MEREGNPSPKAFLILDKLSLSSIRSQLTSRTAIARVPDQTRSVPARASACVRYCSFQLTFQLVPAHVPSSSSPSPKVFLILDKLSLSSIRSQLTSRTATARVPDQTCSVPARASARVRSSSFQLAFQLVPAHVPSSSRFSWWSGSTIFKT
ncbi:hypothetical protein F2Q69_00019576 [Brassica cretica]|uniref:Uncharacterized protein n=1 Tax=Brassica cretica TaxID=69181 RepID=A0A8S9QJE1_BRACR|nr:hypothetical protein F2Q69_00019576 [Brassica cretica]